MNSKLCQTAEMELFPRVVAGFFRGERRILPCTLDGDFCKNSQQQKAVHYIFAKTCILDVWQRSEYASELASKDNDLSFLNQVKYLR